MTSPGPSVIVDPSPAADAVEVRRPRLAVFIDGRQLFTVLAITLVRGLDQALATCEITVPHPLPDWVRYWSRIQVLAGTDTFVERFTGYLTAIDYSLWPGAKTLHCQDVLAIAANHYQPEVVGLEGLDDQRAVQLVLGDCGYKDTTFAGITLSSGTGTILADIDEAVLKWELGVTGLEMLQSIDEISLGWRTYATVGGQIVRTLINTDPNTVSTVHDFAEGVDILDGSLTVEIVDARDEITVSGFDGVVTATLDPTADPFTWMNNSYWKRFLALQTQARAAGILDPQAVAAYILSQVGKRLLKVTFSTHLDTLFQGQEVVKVTSERLEIDQSFWVQSVQLTVGADGAFTQTITGVSALQNKNRHMVVPPVDTTTPDAVAAGVVPGADVPYADLPSPRPASAADIQVDFTVVGIDKETAGDPSNTSDTGQAYYVVTCSDTSISSQSNPNGFTRAWSAAGPGVTVASLSGVLAQTFTTAFTDLAGATITLTLTDGNGNSASKTLPAASSAAPVMARTLFACTDDTMLANDGSQWRSQAPSGASTVQCVANGPMWGCGGLIAISEDYLASPATMVAVFSGNVSSIWISESDSRFAAAGSATGEVKTSTDRGATWTARTSPGSAVNFIIVSIFDSNELHVVTPDGWLKSQDGGVTWDLVRAGDFTYLELSHSRNIVVTADGHLQKAEDGTPFTGITGTVVAATAHIRKDLFYALTSDGNTWIQDTDGSFAMTAGAPIPAGNPYHAGTYRDGQMVDLVFFAAQDGGLFKSIDGFRTGNGYLRLLSEGRLTP